MGFANFYFGTCTYKIFRLEIINVSNLFNCRNITGTIFKQQR